MLKVMLIDDEPSALENMEHIIAEFPEILIVGMYTASEKALAAIEKVNPDVVFLDIEMPGKNGPELARELTGKYPEIKIVFVTAYLKYIKAVSEAGAVDYLLKPVRKERLAKTLSRLGKSVG
jgi:DNA-binding LytR/AlgR family response regulator